MRKFILLVGTSLALAACGSGADEATAPADAETAAPVEMAEVSADVAAMPTEALSGDAASAKLEERHEWFEELGDQFKLLMREAKADSPDMDAVKAATAIVLAKSADLPAHFAPGTGPDAGKTEAKANIWETPDDFMAKAKDFRTAAIDLNAYALAADAAGFKDAFGKTGGTCKACHDSYREED